MLAHILPCGLEIQIFTMFMVSVHFLWAAVRSFGRNE